jgi:UDP-3-O-[3-hydroxymyristoyl] glucosamine N-acyltransferase
MAGQVGVAGHLKIGDNVTVGAQAGIAGNVPDQSTLLGSPAMPISHARRVAAVFVQLPELSQRVRHLEHQVEELGTKEHENGSESR